MSVCQAHNLDLRDSCEYIQKQVGVVGISTRNRVPVIGFDKKLDLIRASGLFCFDSANPTHLATIFVRSDVAQI